MGPGGSHALVMTDVGGQQSLVTYYSESTLDYAPPPFIMRLEGEGSRGAATLGGESVTIVGLNFGATVATLDVVVSPLACSFLSCNFPLLLFKLLLLLLL